MSKTNDDVDLTPKVLPPGNEGEDANHEGPSIPDVSQDDNDASLPKVSHGENNGESDPVNVREKRKPRSTEKGRAFRLDTLMNLMRSIKKRFTKQVELVNNLIDAKTMELLSKEATSMEKIYSEYTDAYARSCGLIAECSEEELADLEELHTESAVLMEEVDATYMKCKTEVCGLLMEEEKSQLSEDQSSTGSSRSRGSKKSSRSSSGSSKSNNSSKSIRQKAKVAGLKAEVEAVKKTKEAELAAEVSRLEQRIKKALAMEQVYASYEEGLKKEELEAVRDQDEEKRITDDKEYENKTKEHRPEAKSKERTNTKKRASQVHLKEVVQPEAAQLQIAMTEMMKLQAAPKPDLDVFSGDPLEYLYFKANFKEVVEATVSDQMGRLTRLIKYTAGEAKELVKHLVHGDPNDCYDVAISLLDKEYGNPHLLSVTYLKKLRNWTGVKENQVAEYKKLYRFLLKCQAYKKNNQLAELDSTEMIRVVVSKLPPGQQSRWGRKAVEIRSSDREANYEDLIKFVAKENEILSDPAYSRDALADVPQVKSNATRCEPTKNKPPTECPLCKENHDIEDCEEYLEKDVDQRHKTIFHRNLCFSCLKTIGGTHVAKSCTEGRKCRVCNGAHPTTLHDGKGTLVHHTSLENNVISMCVVPVQLWHKGRPDLKVTVYCLLDDCSQGTFIKEDVFHSLNVPGRETALTVTTINAQCKEPTVEIEKGDLIVQCMPKHAELYSATTINLPVTFTRQTLAVDYEEIPTPSKIKKWAHFQTLVDKIPDYDPAIPIGLMIGGNCPQALTPMEVIEGPSNGSPFAKRSRLGWSIVGPISSCSSRDNINCNSTRIIPAKDICTGRVSSHYYTIPEKTQETSTSAMLKEMYATEFNEVASEKQSLSREDELFLETMRNGAQRIHGKMEVPLPFRNNDVRLPNNREHIFKRLLSLKRRFQRDSEKFSEYKQEMERTIRLYARRADKSKDEPGKIWYTAHHGVRNEQKGKLRVVFNPSELFRGRCLNDELLQGPDLANKLVGVLIRFRKENIALMADIEAMFYQVRVPEHQRSFLRFFWWENSDLNSPIVEYEMCVHMFGLISSGGCCNFALQKSADDFVNDFGSEAASAIQRNFYIDDWLKSVCDAATAKTLINNVRAMCAAGGFNLTKFVSNSQEAINDVPMEKRAASMINLEFSNSPRIERALGVQWCVEKDMLNFRIILKDTPMTRRGILGTISSIYDPLGLASPFLLKGRKVLQGITMEKADWDDDVSEETRNNWQKWRTELLELQKLQIPRCYKPPGFNAVSATLHSFSDASEYGYGTATYLRQVDSEGKVCTRLVMGKSRVVPSNAPTTIPRLELVAAVLSAKVSSLVLEELDMEQVEPRYWIDSTPVIGYLQNDTKRYKTFVSNRCRKFRSMAQADQIGYVSTDDNPADDASRGLSVYDTEKINRWFNGPAFLEDDQFMKRTLEVEVSEDDPEVQKEVKANAACVKTEDNHILLHLESRSSCWMRMRRIVATVRAFIQRLRSERRSSMDLTPEDVTEAENAIIRMLQAKCFPEEVGSLKESKGVKKTSAIRKLNPFLDGRGVLRVGGRLKKSFLSDEIKHPAILPKKEIIVTRIVEWHHQNIAHLGRTATLGELRSRGLWLINGNSQVRQVVYRCVPCRALRGLPTSQKMAELPERRTSDAPPFTYCGIDLFGPFVVMEGRKELKRYGVVFTCFGCRAIHIETTTTLETDSFILSLRRFVTRRGPVRTISSDNGSNFVGADNEMKKALKELDRDKIRSFLLRHSCEWVEWDRNPPQSSHTGGVWERQIRSIRAVLAGLLKDFEGRLNDESLRTLLCEVECIVNSRPLTSDSLSDETIEPLTPNHLLTMKSKVVLPPPGIFQRADVYCRRRWRAVQYLANEFWNRWRKEYLLNQQQRQKWTTARPNLEIGDIVLVMDNDLPRNQWPMGRIVEVYASEDGLVRKVDVRVAGSKNPLQRSVAKLIPLLKVPSNEK